MNPVDPSPRDGVPMSSPDLGFVHVYQPASEPHAPTLLLLHGSGGHERNLLPVAATLAPRAAVLSPRGKVLEDGMPRFFRRLAPGVFDPDDLVTRIADLADFVARAGAHYGFDPGHVIAVGFSNGANAAASLLLLKPRVLRAAVLFSALLPIDPPAQPDLEGVRVFITGGRADRIITPERTQQLVTVLERGGAIVDVRWREGGHSLTRDDVEAAREWLERHTRV